jgi:hypothetical protein
MRRITCNNGITEGAKEHYGRLVGLEPTTSRITIWRYYRLSYSRRIVLSLASELFRSRRSFPIVL